MAMHPGAHATTHPEKPAYIMAPSGDADGETVTYRELDAASNRFAHALRRFGLRHRDGIALCLENHARYYEVVWGAQRAGLYYTAVSTRLTPGELEYIVNDCGAAVFVTSHALADLAAPRHHIGRLLRIDRRVRARVHRKRRPQSASPCRRRFGWSPLV